MANASYKVSEARAHFSELLNRAQASEEILITHSKEPLARLVPPEGKGQRRIGVLRGLLNEEELAALTEAIEAPLSDRDQRILEGEGTDDVGLWIGLPEDRKDG